MFLIYQKGYNIVFVVGTFFFFLKKGKHVQRQKDQKDAKTV